MTTYDLGKVVGSDGEDGVGIQSITKTGTSGLVDTYTILYTDGTSTTFNVTNGEDGTADIVTSWESTLSDEKIPSEKLTKNSLDGKVDVVSGKGLSTNDYTTNEKNKLSGIESEANKTTIVTSFGSTTSDSKVPSEKLVKDTLDTKANSSSLATVATSGSYSDLSNKPSLATVATSGDYDDLMDKPTIPSDVSDLTDTHDTAFTPKTHTHAKTDITDFPSLATVATSGDYDDLTDKPSIPSKTSDLQNDGDGTNVFVKDNDSRLSDARTPSSHTHGNLQNDGAVGTSNNASKNVVTDSNGKITTEAKPTIPTKTSDLTNDSGFITSSSISGMLTTSDIVNDLTTGGTNKVLSAEQGKELASLIGDIEADMLL